MSKNISELPFTEICERVQELGRERVDAMSKIRGTVNDFYVREFPRKMDWNFFLAQSTITVQGQYNTGTVTATTGSTTVTFSSDAVLTQSNNLWWLKISGNDYVYQFTFSQTTGGTLNVPLSGTVNAQNASFNLFQPYYSLASNFDRFPKNGGLILYQGGQENIISELAYQDWATYYTPSPTNIASYCRLYGVDTAGNTLMEINPPPATAVSYRYDYFIKPAVMYEMTNGLIGNISNNGTNVIGDSNCQFTRCNTGDYLRIDAFGTSADSEWYRIIAIANDSALTLQSAFRNTGNGTLFVTSAKYTICSAPAMPYKMHPAILYGSLLQLTVDQNDPMVTAYNTKFAEVLSDGKRLYVSRIYNQTIHSMGEQYLYRR